MASTGYNLNATDVALGRAAGAGVDRYIAANPDTTEADIAEACGRRAGWLSEIRAGRESLRARDIRSLFNAGIREPFIELCRLCRSVPMFLAKDGPTRVVVLADVKPLIKEHAEAVAAVIDFSGEDRPTEGKKLDALREIDEAIMVLIEARELVAAQRVSRA